MATYSISPAYPNDPCPSCCHVLDRAEAKTVYDYLLEQGEVGKRAVGSYWDRVYGASYRRAVHRKATAVSVYTAGFSMDEFSQWLGLLGIDAMRVDATETCRV